MVARNVLAFDSDALLVDGSSPFQTPGNSIINNSNTPNGTIFEFQSGFGRQQVVVDDQGGDPDIFEDGLSGSHSILDGGGLIPNGTAVESESIIFLRELDASGNQTGPTIRLTVFSKGGVTQDIWGFATDDFLVPGTKYVKTSGSNNGDSDYEDFVPCFTRDTLIRVPGGHMAVQDIAAGDVIWTASNPEATVTWVGSTTVAAVDHLAPIRFEAGVVGNTTPLLVSPQHRMLLSGTGPQLLFSTEAVLVPAKHLLGLEGVTRVTGGDVEYFHLMLSAHEVIEANGALSESFFPGDVAISHIDKAARAEILELFPNIENQIHATVFPCLRGRDAAVMREYLTH